MFLSATAFDACSCIDICTCTLQKHSQLGFTQPNRKTAQTTKLRSAGIQDPDLKNKLVRFLFQKRRIQILIQRFELIISHCSSLIFARFFPFNSEQDQMSRFYPNPQPRNKRVFAQNFCAANWVNVRDTCYLIKHSWRVSHIYISISSKCFDKKTRGGESGNKKSTRPITREKLRKDSLPLRNRPPSAPDAYRESKGYYIGSCVRNC